jgi:hypothetical protein
MLALSLQVTKVGLMQLPLIETGGRLPRKTLMTVL